MSPVRSHSLNKYYNIRTSFRPPISLLPLSILHLRMGLADSSGANSYANNMPPPIQRQPGRLTFLDLPLETQQQIAGHVCSCNLSPILSNSFFPDGPERSLYTSASVPALSVSCQRRIIPRLGSETHQCWR